MASDWIGTKLNPRMVFRYQFSVPVMRKPDDKDLRYFHLSWSGGADNTRWKKCSLIRSDAYFPEWKPAFRLYKDLRLMVCLLSMGFCQ